MERTIVVSVVDEAMEIPFDFPEGISEDEMQEMAVDYVMSYINIELI